MQLMNFVTYRVSRGPSIFLDKSGRGRDLCRPPRLSLISSLPLPDLSRKIEGPLLAGYLLPCSRTRIVEVGRWSRLS